MSTTSAPSEMNKALPRKKVPSIATTRRRWRKNPLPGGYRPPRRDLAAAVLQTYNLLAFRTLAGAGRVGGRSKLLRRGLGGLGNGIMAGAQGFTAVKEAFKGFPFSSVGYYGQSGDAFEELVLGKSRGIRGGYFRKETVVAKTPQEEEGGEKGGKDFSLSFLSPLGVGWNGKLIVAPSGLGMSGEAFWRNGDRTQQDSVLKDWMRMGCRALIVDFPKIGKQRRHSFEEGTIDTMVNGILPGTVNYLYENPQLYEEGLYFIGHSLGGLSLNAFMAQFFAKPKNGKYRSLFKNKMTLGTPEVPLPDKHAFYLLVALLYPFFGDSIQSIPYEGLNALIKKIPPRLLINRFAELSMIACNHDFPPGLLYEMFDYAVEDFSAYLALELAGGVLRGYYRDLDRFPRILVDGQRNVRVAGLPDPLAAADGLYLRLTGGDTREQQVLMKGIRSEEDVPDAITAIGQTPITAVVIEEMSHLAIATMHADFRKRVRPLMFAFLEEERQQGAVAA